jgi:large subunit ribosomal protein L40
MAKACDELERLTRRGEEGGEGLWSRTLYDAAMAKVNPYKEERITGRKSTPYSRWKEGRLDGLIPREAVIPCDSKGRGWNYEWKQPEDK